MPPDASVADRVPGAGKPRVNVNLAPSELLNANLAREVDQVLEETGLAPECLVLEITEDGVMRNPEEARATMRRLRGLGVSLALDDFGTGHSSLAHLREFPIHTLKIAKPFVSALHDGQANAAFVETIVQLAGTLDQGVVAEGVESAEQAAEVARLGCGYAQGYYFGAPLAGLGVSQYLSSPRLPAAVATGPATKQPRVDVKERARGREADAFRGLRVADPRERIRDLRS